MFTEEALEINKNVSASISTSYDDEGDQYFFRISIGKIFEWKFFVYSGMEEFAEITPFEPTIEKKPRLFYQ